MIKNYSQTGKDPANLKFSKSSKNIEIFQINDWELIGSRTYSWKGNEVLRCKHWDKVAIRWHLSTCTEHGVCDGGTNVDYATRAQNWTEMPVWRNAFTYVQIPGQLQVIQCIQLLIIFLILENKISTTRSYWLRQ